MHRTNTRWQSIFGHSLVVHCPQPIASQLESLYNCCPKRLCNNAYSCAADINMHGCKVWYDVKSAKLSSVLRKVVQLYVALADKDADVTRPIAALLTLKQGAG